MSAGLASSQIATVPSQAIQTNSNTTVPVAVTTSKTLFRSAVLIGNKAAQTPNVGTVYLGFTSGDGTQPISLVPGEVKVLQADPGEAFDLNTLFLDVATVADGVVVLYS